MIARAVKRPAVRAHRRTPETTAGDAPNGDAASQQCPHRTDESGDESTLQMQTSSGGEHGEDEGTHTGTANLEPEQETTGKEDGEESDTDPSLEQRPEPANAESYTDRIDVGTGANRGRKSAHGGQLRSHRKDREQEVREHEDREIRSERRRGAADARQQRRQQIRAVRPGQQQEAPGARRRAEPQEGRKRTKNGCGTRQRLTRPRRRHE